jgi:hypothetical protein
MRLISWTLRSGSKQVCTITNHVVKLPAPACTVEPGGDKHHLAQAEEGVWGPGERPDGYQNEDHPAGFETNVKADNWMGKMSFLFI